MEFSRDPLASHNITTSVKSHRLGLIRGCLQFLVKRRPPVIVVSCLSPVLDVRTGIAAPSPNCGCGAAGGVARAGALARLAGALAAGLARAGCGGGGVPALTCCSS